MSAHFERVVLRIKEEPYVEPVATVEVRIFNGTLFSMELTDPTLAVFFHEVQLAIAARVEKPPGTLPPGGQSVLRLIQPLSDGLAKSISNLVKQKEILAWEFEFSTRYRAVETGIEGELKTDRIRRHEIAWET